MFRTLPFTLALILPAQAHAITAGDFLDRMNAEERSGFVNGALDMLNYNPTIPEQRTFRRIHSLRR
jgi:hypothetical protein